MLAFSLLLTEMAMSHTIDVFLSEPALLRPSLNIISSEPAPILKVRQTFKCMDQPILSMHRLENPALSIFCCMAGPIPRQPFRKRTRHLAFGPPRERLRTYALFHAAYNAHEPVISTIEWSYKSKSIYPARSPLNILCRYSLIDLLSLTKVLTFCSK